MHTPDFLRTLLSYDPTTGELRYRRATEDMFPTARYPQTICASWNAKYSDQPAGTVRDANGYLCCNVLGVRYLTHRVAWALHTGRWPEQYIDHVNGDPGDNRIANLRGATHAQNLYNQGAYKNNTSGYKGVSWNKKARKWQAKIRVNRVLKHVGLFDCPEEAHAAYCAAARVYHGEFANGGAPAP